MRRCLLLWSLVIATLPMRGQDLPDVLLPANTLLNERNYEEALEELERLRRKATGDDRLTAEMLLLEGKALTHLYRMDEAEEAYRSAAELGEAVQDTLLIARGLNALAVLIEFRGEANEVEHLARRVIALAPKDTAYLSDAWTLLALTHVAQGRISEGMAAYEKAIRLDLSTGDDRSVPFNYSGLARLLAQQGRVDEALEAYFAGIEHLRGDEDGFKLATFHLEIAGLFLRQAGLAKAGEYAASALVLAREHGLASREAEAHQLLGTIALARDQVDTARVHLQQALAFHEEKGIRKEVLADRTLLARADLLDGDLASARAAWDSLDVEAIEEDMIRSRGHLLTGAEIALASGEATRARALLDRADAKLPYGHSSYQDLLSRGLRYRAARMEGDWRAAFAGLEAYGQLKDSLFRQEQDRTVHELEARFDKANKEKAIADLNADNAIQKAELRRKNWQVGASLLGIALSGIIILLVVRQYRTSRRLNRELAGKNAVIEQALKEKELLLREIHHRVKNNLQVVSSLLSIQSRGITDVKAREAVRDSRDRVKSMALIHQDLYKEDDLTGIDMATYVGKLARSLLSSHQLDPEQVRLVTDVEKLSLDVDTTIPLGLILNELLTNVLKYAFPDGRTGEVRVRLARDGDRLHLQVRDNGVGYDPNAIRGEESSGFGLDMVRTFANKLQAEWEVRNDGGTVVDLRIGKFKLAS